MRDDPLHADAALSRLIERAEDTGIQVVSANTEMTALGLRVQTLGMFGYLIAGVLGLGLSWAIFRSGRLH